VERRRRSLVVAAAAIVLVTIAAAESAAGTGSAPRHLQLPSVGVLLLGALFVCSALVFVVLVSTMIGGGPNEPRHRSFLSQLGAVLAFLAFVVAIALLAQHLRPAASTETADTSPTQSSDTSPRAPAPLANADRVGGVLALLALGVGAALIAGRRMDRRTAERADLDADVAAEIGDVLDDVVADLRLDPDPRHAVIAAYDRTEQTFAHHGLPRRPSEAPYEFLARVLDRLDVGGPAASTLTDLYERAMYSHRPVDVGMQAAAIEALVTVRDDLRSTAYGLASAAP
jgi:hypothetical protein